MKKSFVLMLCLIGICHFSYASTVSSVFILNNDSVYEKVDVDPVFKTGMKDIIAYMNDNVKYPKEALAKKESARVFIEFVVDKSGHIRDVRSLKNVKKYFEDEVVRVVSEMPLWKAGTINGKNVNTRLVLPVTFKL